MAAMIAGRMDLPRRRAGLWASERGAELIEFALIFPMLLVVVMGIADFGFLFQKYEVVTNAAREGARVAILPGYTNADVQARVNQYITAAGLPGSATTVVAPAATLSAGGQCITVRPVTVSYTHNFTFVGPLLSLLGGSALTSKTLNATVAMRTEIAASSTC